MINLLPDEYKREIRAARTNVLLVRYIMILVSAVVILGALSTGTYVVLNNSKSSAEQKVADNQNRVIGFTTVKTQADAFRTDLATAKSVYDSKVSYAKLIYKIADAVPRNVILEGLTLDAKTFGSSTSLNASAKTIDDGTKLQETFIGRPDLFSNVKLEKLQYTAKSDGGSNYPVKVSLSVVIVKEALNEK